MSDSKNSNVTAFSDRNTIKMEAGAWLVKIDHGKLSSYQITEFQEWISRSTFHQEYLEKLAKNWDSMSVLSELAEIFPINNHISTKEQKKDKKTIRPLFSPVWLTSGVSVCLLIIFLVFNNDIDRYTTAIGEQSNIQLDDGSKISLNTDSQIKVDFTGDMRVIHLLKGEANFDVSKNPNRPFVVYAGSGMVWAVGTIFNVRYTHDDNIDVMITEGTVKVYAKTEHLDTISSDLSFNSSELFKSLSFKSSLELPNEAIASAGELITYNEVIEKHDELVQSDLNKKIAWQSGTLLFSGESLEYAIQEISRYTDKEIIIIDPSIKDIQVGGHFKTNDIDGLLVSLSKGFNLHIEQVSNNLIHLSNQKL